MIQTFNSTNFLDVYKKVELPISNNNTSINTIVFPLETSKISNIHAEKSLLTGGTTSIYEYPMNLIGTGFMIHKMGNGTIQLEYPTDTYKLKYNTNSEKLEGDPPHIIEYSLDDGELTQYVLFRMPFIKFTYTGSSPLVVTIYATTASRLSLGSYRFKEIPYKLVREDSSAIAFFEI